MSTSSGLDVIAAWRLTLDTAALLVERVEAALAHEDLPPLAWYDVLWALREAPGCRLRQADLVRAVVMSRSGLKRLVDRMEAAGYLRREACPDRRGGIEVVLTADGRAMQRKMWPIYSGCIATYFGAYLQDPRGLQRLLRPVASAMRSLG